MEKSYEPIGRDLGSGSCEHVCKGFLGEIHNNSRFCPVAVKKLRNMTVPYNRAIRTAPFLNPRSIHNSRYKLIARLLSVE